MPDLDFYDGAYTGSQIDQRLGNMVVRVTGTLSPQNNRINDAKILANHIVIYALTDNPMAFNGNWTVNTYAGYLEVTGTIRESTTVVLTLGLT